MANWLGFVVLSVILLIMGVATVTVSGYPMTDHEGMTNGEKIRAVCSTGVLDCAEIVLPTLSADHGVHRDMSIHTINDIQKDFFLESALVGGGKMSLDQNLHDPAAKRAFLTSSAAEALPELTSSNTLALMKHLGVAPNTDVATAIATAAYLCGYGALPGEAMHCATSVSDMANFVSVQLGPKVKVLSTSGTPASAPSVKAPVTIMHVSKGSVAEGKRIVVCHHVDFPSELYYCHRVTGTKVVKATLKPGHGNVGAKLIKATGICHIDTSLWLSTHPAFATLNIPRGDEACHWLVDTDLVFVPVVNELDRAE